MTGLGSVLAKPHLHIVVGSPHVVKLEEIQSLTNFVEKDSAGMMAFVVVDDVGYYELVAAEMIISDLDVLHLMKTFLFLRIEGNDRLLTI